MKRFLVYSVVAVLSLTFLVPLISAQEAKPEAKKEIMSDDELVADYKTMAKQHRDLAAKLLSLAASLEKQAQAVTDPKAKKELEIKAKSERARAMKEQAIAEEYQCNSDDCALPD